MVQHSRFSPLILVILTGLSINVSAQFHIPDPDSILQRHYTPTDVLLFGTFHFAYYNLDAHKVDSKNQVDVLSEQGQKELAELIDQLAVFKPSKIVIESGVNTGYLMHQYRNWLEGKTLLESDEIYQIAFPLMKRFKLDTLYGVDAGTLVWTLYDSKDSLCMRAPLDSIFKDWDFQSDDEMSKRYSSYYKFKDSLTTQLPLTAILRYMNTRKYRERTYGSYLCGDFTNGQNTEGADALALHWYSRNLRIFRNIQKLRSSADDRILVIYGAGHMGILDHLFRASPEFLLHDLHELESHLD
jgi:hypothetical protein